MDECDLNEIYDRRLLVKGTLVSYILLVVYIPIGLALLTLRLLFSLISSFLVSLSPGLRTSTYFTKMYANLMGVHVVDHQHSTPFNGVRIVSYELSFSYISNINRYLGNNILFIVLYTRLFNVYK